MNKVRIERELKKYRRRRHLGLLVPIIGFCLLVPVGGGVLGFLILVIAIFGGAFIRIYCYYKSKNVVLRDVAEAVIEQYVHDLFYEPLAPLIESTLKKVYLALPQYSQMHASDHIKGTYNGRSIEIADIHLVRRYNDDSETVFLGPLLKVETSKRVSSSITISTNKKELFINNIKTENITFNEIFNIYCKDLDEPYSILTDDMMERMMTFEKDKQGDVYFCFSKGGYLYCAIDERIDRFEFDIKQKTIEAIIEGFDSDVRYVLSLIDELIDMLDDQNDYQGEDLK